MRVLSLLGLTVLSCCAFAQSTSPLLTIETELARLGRDALLLQHDLPSVTCRETAVSQYKKKSDVKQEVRFIAEVDAQRLASGRLVEHYRFKELNGIPYTGPEPRTPMFVEGALNEGLLYFLPSMQPFFVFTLSPDRIEYKARPDAMGTPQILLAPSTHGFVLLDETGAITHLERNTDAKEAQRIHVTDYAAYDFTQTELNGAVYPLATRNVAESHRGNETLRFEAALTGCHLFHASSTILPGATPVPDQQQEPHH